MRKVILTTRNYRLIFMFCPGAIELPLNCAQMVDPDNTGLEFWYSGSPVNDPRSEFYARRSQCYDLVLDSLSVFEGKAGGAKVDGVVDSTAIDTETVRSHAYELAFASEDEMFHSTMYDWLIDRGIADELLEVRPSRHRSPRMCSCIFQMRPAFLEAHLKREPVTAAKYQLLWQFYVKDGQPLRAAEVLGTLAESMQSVVFHSDPHLLNNVSSRDRFDLTLNTRLEYLTLAVGNAKSHPISVSGKHETAIAFLSDLEEKLDVAQVQLEIYNTLQHISDTPEVVEKVNLLSKRLFTMSEVRNLNVIHDLVC